MKNDRKYQIRRLIAAIIILAVFMVFTMSVMVKGVDFELSRRDRVIQEHMEVWE